jgi:hypothetical protein
VKIQSKRLKKIVSMSKKGIETKLKLQLKEIDLKPAISKKKFSSSFRRIDSTKVCQI